MIEEAATDQGSIDCVSVDIDSYLLLWLGAGIGYFVMGYYIGGYCFHSIQTRQRQDNNNIIIAENII